MNTPKRVWIQWLQQHQHPNLACSYYEKCSKSFATKTFIWIKKREYQTDSHIPSKYFPWESMQRCILIFQLWNHWAYSQGGILFSSEWTARARSWMREHSLPQMAFFTFGNNQKSHGVRPGEYGGWGRSWTPASSINNRCGCSVCRCVVMMQEQARAASSSCLFSAVLQNLQ